MLSHSHILSSSDYYRTPCPHGGEASAIPHAIGRQSKSDFLMQSFRVRDSGSWPSAMRASGEGLSLKESFCCYCRLRKACYSHAHTLPSSDYYRSPCPHGGEASAIPHAIGRQSKSDFLMQSFRVRDSGSWPSAMRASGEGLSLKELFCCYCLQK